MPGHAPNPTMPVAVDDVLTERPLVQRVVGHGARHCGARRGREQCRGEQMAPGDQHRERHGGIGDESRHRRLEQRSAEHGIDDGQGHHRDEQQQHGAAVEPLGGRRLVHPTSVRGAEHES